MELLNTLGFQTSALTPFKSMSLAVIDQLIREFLESSNIRNAARQGGWWWGRAPIKQSGEWLLCNIGHSRY